MRIRQISNLVKGKKYWHLSLESNSNWTIGVIDAEYESNNVPENWENMIVFDNEPEARMEARHLQAMINPLLIY